MGGKLATGYGTLYSASGAAIGADGCELESATGTLGCGLLAATGALTCGAGAGALGGGLGAGSAGCGLGVATGAFGAGLLHPANNIATMAIIIVVFILFPPISDLRPYSS